MRKSTTAVAVAPTMATECLDCLCSHQYYIPAVLPFVPSHDRFLELPYYAFVLCGTVGLSSGYCWAVVRIVADMKGFAQGLSWNGSDGGGSGERWCCLLADLSKFG